MRSTSVLDNTDPAVVGPSRLADRVLACVLGASLDESLASGRPPESARLLAARARHIVSPRRRASMAGNWEHLLQVAHRAARTWPAPRSMASARAVPICADRIVAAEPAIRELMTRLSVPLPVPARGVAMAGVLLTDATGPVYNRRSPRSLTAAVEAAIIELDPSLPLEDWP